MRTFLRYLFLALILMVVALASALTAMRFAIHGREVEVPRLTGLAPAEAEQTAHANGLLFSLENRFYSPDVPEGKVLTQVPAAGEKVRRGSRIRVAESLGPQRVIIPDVIGQSRRAAEINLTRRGLELGTVALARLPGVAQEVVVAQSPPANATGAASPKVNLLIAQPPDSEAALIMPDLTGRTLDEASALIAQIGLTFGEVKSRRGATPLPQPIVAGHTPAAGERVVAAAVVNLEVQR